MASEPFCVADTLSCSNCLPPKILVNRTFE